MTKSKNPNHPDSPTSVNLIGAKSQSISTTIRQLERMVSTKDRAKLLKDDIDKAQDEADAYKRRRKS